MASSWDLKIPITKRRLKITFWKLPPDLPGASELRQLRQMTMQLINMWNTSQQPGPRFTNIFSIAVQIRWKFHFILTSILIQLSLQNYLHSTTAVLLWHVQIFVAIWWPAMELQQGTVSIKFELRAKNHSWNGPLDKWVILWGLSINRTWSIPGNIPIMYLDHGKAKLLKYMLSIMIMFYWKKKKISTKIDLSQSHNCHARPVQVSHPSIKINLLWPSDGIWWKYGQRWFRKWLVAWRHPAITWTNAD